MVQLTPRPDIAAERSHISEAQSQTSAIQLVATGVLLFALAWLLMGGRVEVAYGCVATASLVMLLTILASRDSDPFHPWAFPQAYWVYALTAPWFFMAVSGRELRLIPLSSLGGDGAKVIALASIGWVLGTAIGSNPSLAHRPIYSSAQRTSSSRGVQWSRPHFRAMRSFGAVTFMAVLALKAVQVLLGRGRSYGEGQLQVDAFSTLTTIVEGLFTAAILLLALTARPLGHKILPAWLLVGVAAYAGASLLFLGSRGELIAPAILLLWFASREKKIRISTLAALIAGAMLLFNWTGDRRLSGSSTIGTQDTSFIERSLIDTSSPFIVTNLLAEAVPNSAPFLGGDTYLESLKYILPGIVSRAIFGAPDATASLIFRDIIGFSNQNTGFGFSLPSEAYLNFGRLGALAIPLLLGHIFSRMYVHTAGVSRRLMSVVYPVALAALPYGVRSDSLGQLKMILYPLAIIAIAALLAKRRAREDN